ncbi:MAG TPA: hypothetical protein VF483_04240 [Gemmatimonadaceae bacterium]
MAGAVLQPASAQVRDTVMRRDSANRRDTIMTPRDSARARLKAHADSVARRDSIIRADSIKPGIAQAELPVLADPSGNFHWTRKDMFSSGAIDVMDLLERVPGLVGLHSSWIAQPMMAAYLGDMRRVRVYVDGFELEELDPRNGRVWDLSSIPLWSLDDLLVERTASEIRIHMRSWRVERTTPYSRTDIYTGDQSTNLYRGYFGTRFRHGEVLQLSAQEFSTTPGRSEASNDQLGFMSRIGIARRTWTADVVIHRTGGNRGQLINFANTDTVPGTEYTQYDAYARLAWQDTARGWWAQALAGASTLAYNPPGGAKTPDADTGKSRSQYVFTGGYARGPWHATFTQRFLNGAARHVATPAIRAAWDTKLLTVSAIAEGRGLDSTRRFDVSAALKPTSFLFVSGAVSNERPLLDSTGTPVFTRVEAGVRAGDVWISVGALHRDPVELDPAPVVGRRAKLVFDSSALGTFATVSGRVWKAIYVEAQGTRWNDTAAIYRPQYQTRAEVYLSTSLLKWVPSGNTHIRLGVSHEYRSSMLWPDTSGTTVKVPGFRVVSTSLHWKIVSAELFWVYRNAFNEKYPEIPGYRMPRLSSTYGVRWEFWN